MVRTATRWHASNNRYEEVIDPEVLSTLPWRISQWLRVDLPSKIRALGVPVLHVQRESIPPARHEIAAPSNVDAGAQRRLAEDPLIVDMA